MTYEKLKTETNTSILQDTVCALLIYICLCLSAESRFFGGHFIGAVWGCLYIAADFGAERIADRKKFARLLPVLTAVAPSIIALPSLTSHLAELANCVLTVCFERFHMSVRLFDGAEYGIFADCAIGAAAAWILTAIVRSEKKIPKYICGILIIAVGAVFSDGALQAASAALAAMLLFLSADKNGGLARIFVRGGLAAAAFLIAVTSVYAAYAADFSVQTLTAFRFGGDGYRQPNGDLANAEAFKPQNSEALEVVMDSPEPMYLHGFLGYEYADGVWSEPDFSRLSGQLDEILYLDSADFNVQDQTARLIAAADVQTFDKNSVLINNVGADSRYAYLPAVTCNEDIGADNYALSLENRSGFLPRKRTYSAETYAGFIEKSGELTGLVVKSQTETNARSAEYLQNAALLDDIYCENFTAVPDDVRRILDAQLGGYHCEQGDLNGAANVIYDYLGGFSYDENAEKLTLEEFLQTAHSGYSIHFASAAVEIFRYYGIPARYAEGYAVTYDRAEGRLSGSPIQLTDADFHAWAEYYLAGAGWIPFETTPEYFEKMPLPEGVSAQSGEESDMLQSVEPTTLDAVTGDRIAQKLPDEPSESDKDFSGLIVLPAVLIVIAAALTVRRIRSAKRIRSDISYAIFRCANMLSGTFPVTLGTDGNYDFSVITDSELSAELNELQDICIKQFYADNSHKDEVYSNGVFAYEVYLKCRSFLCGNKNTYAKILLYIKELFFF